MFSEIQGIDIKSSKVIFTGVDLPDEGDIITASVVSFTVEGSPDTFWGYEIAIRFNPDGDDPGSHSQIQDGFPDEETAIAVAQEWLVYDFELPIEEVVDA